MIDLQPREHSGESGQILILTAVAMTALLGVAALSIDASFMYDKRNRLHAAADGAAKSAAIEMHRNSTATDANLLCFATQQVTAHGFSPTGCGLTGTTAVTVRRCNNVSATCSSPFSGKSAFVEVILSEPTSTFFGAVLGWSSLTPTARAVAGTSPGTDCIVTTGPGPNTGPGGAAVAFSVGNATLNMSSCGLAVDGNLDGTNSNATINASSVDASGSCLESCSHISNLHTGSLTTSNPLSGMTAPTNPGGCTSVNNPTSLTAGCYSSMQLGSNVTL